MTIAKPTADDIAAVATRLGFHSAVDPEFTVHEWDTRHNVMHDGPDRVYDLIIGL